jgi:hypothetical protein
LQFEQPRALALKVSDEFTVPLCRGHHRQLHQAGNEVAWWQDLDINALEIAKSLWAKSRGKSLPIINANTSNCDGGNSVGESTSDLPPSFETTMGLKRQIVFGFYKTGAAASSSSTY